ncbi:MAG: FtsX-like permease family protein [Verrucomicrobia bacterium]|nr:FtsX-like permease family protein [Verrucomicrobiota bacterium]
MNIGLLVWREIGHRKLNFALGLASVAIAVGCLIGAITLLKADQQRTAEILAAKQADVEKAGADLEDSMRKIMLGLGFNVLILPRDQDLNELHLEGTLSRSMPERYVERLAQSEIVLVNHLLPTVVKKIAWPEHHMSVILQGTRGEVPLAHADPKKPILDAVPPGRIILGYRVQQKLQLQPGSRVTLLGRPFEVLKAYGERGTADDSTVWIHLSEAQQLLGLENLIHAILALECHCAGTRITDIRKEIETILPGTQVIERGPPALARAEARSRAKDSAEQALAMETAHRRTLRAQRERFAAVLVPVVLAGGAVWIGLLAFANVRERRVEIGLWRAMGFRSSQVLGIFLGRALAMGLAGAVAGVLAGIAFGFTFGEGAAVPGRAGAMVDLPVVTLGLGVAVALSFLGCWLPAMMAARQDPAVVLQQE